MAHIAEAAPIGQWILVDVLSPDEPGLLSIGPKNYSGASVRKNLEPISRELLFDRIRRVGDTRAAIDETADYRGTRYRAYAEPVFSPITNNLVAVRGIFVDVDAPLPERPLTGALEWRIAYDGHIDTAWNDELFGIYEVDRSGASATGDMNQWVSQLIAPEDRARMKVTIDAAIKSGNAQRYLVPYRVVTRFGTDNPGAKNLEVSGRVIPDEAAGVKWLRAITREVSEITPTPITPGFGDYQSSSLLRAVFDLATDMVVMAVDTSCWQTFMTSKSWEKFGLQIPRFGYLPHIIDPGEFRAFTDVLEQADASAPAVISFMHTDGRYLPYRITASAALGLSTTSTRYVMVQMSPA